MLAELGWTSIVMLPSNLENHLRNSLRKQADLSAQSLEEYLEKIEKYLDGYSHTLTIRDPHETKT